MEVAGTVRGRLARLWKLASVEWLAQGAGESAKTCLPQHGIVEQTFNQNHRGKLANGFPGEQAALGAWKESMGDGGNDSAAVEVDDASALAAREDNAPVESIMTLRVEQAETL